MATPATRPTQAMPASQTNTAIKVEETRPALPSIIPPSDPNTPAADSKADVNVNNNASNPLGPPSRPITTIQTEGTNYFSKEPNPFENAFGSSDTPAKTQLPGVTSLTSPAPLLGGATPGWPGSLRSGPLSPAMLAGPTNNDYFNSDHHFAGSFPTPNESSLRTGLTPGGAQSFLPQPSPSSQALFSAIQNGGATPGTLDFHRTAMHARAASSNQKPGFEDNAGPGQDPNIQPNLDGKGNASREPFEQHDANDAANGLFLLAQAGNNGGSLTAQYPPPQQSAQMNYMPNAPLGQSEAAPMTGKRGRSSLPGSAHADDGEMDSAEDNRSSARGKGKKRSASKSGSGRRKTEPIPSKGGNKRQKGNNGLALSDMGMDDDEEQSMEEEEYGENGRKLTDEEKRKNFLERNRVAALKCRQRKKQWLSNLQNKVELYSTENDALAATVTQLREEIVGLKTLLLAHKDCPVAQAQGISGMAMQGLSGDGQSYASNPYANMQMGQHGLGQHAIPPPANMQRR